MVTFSFDLVAFTVGVFIGLIIGMLAFALVELRDSGMWSIGFTEGSRIKYNMEDFEKRLKELNDITKNMKKEWHHES